MKRIILIFISLLWIGGIVKAQTTCETAQPFCAGGVSGGQFPATVNGPAAQSGPNYGCLGSEPNPAWYFLQISQAGNLDILIAGTANQDVDFICWGPFSNLSGVCNSLTASYIVDCSYSSSPTETLNIVGATVGQYYMVLITNFSNMPQNINFTQIAGTGSTNCAIVPTNTTICAGNVATINISNNSNLANPSYSVQPGPIFPSGNSFTVSPSVTTSYTIYVTGTNTLNNSVVTQSGVATVTVLPAPVASPSLVNSSCTNLTNSVNLNVSFVPASSPNYTVLWSPNPANYTPVNSATATGLQAGIQNVTITTGSCSVVKTFSVGAVQAPASFTVFNPANNYTVSCSNPVVVLNTSVTNNVPLSFTWMPTCTGTVNAPSMSFTQQCLGQVIGTSSTGCSMTRTFQVFEDYSSPTVAITPTAINVSCTPGAGCFTLTSNPDPNIQTQWYQAAGSGSVPVGPVQGTIDIMCPSSPGIYWGCAKNMLTGCASCSSVQVSASTGVPSFTVTSSTNFTVGCGSTSLTSIQVSTVLTDPPNLPVNYTFTPPGSTVVITATTVLGTNPNQNNISQPGTWVVYVKDLTNNCLTSQSVSIIQNTIAPNVDYIQPLSILSCKDPSMVLQGISSNPNTTITWTVPASPSPSVNPTPNYTVVINPAINGSTNNITSVGSFTVGAVDNNNQCIGTKVVQISQDLRIPKFTISALTNSAINCVNPDVVIVPIITPSLAAALIPTFEWYPPVGNMVPGSSYNTTSAGSHTSISTSAINGCTASATYIVATDLNPPTITAGQTFTLDCNANPTVMIIPIITPSVGPYTFSWTAPPVVLISNPTGRNLTANQSGLYKIAVTNTLNGCQSSESYIVVNGALVADFVPNPQQGFAPLAVNFNNTSSTSTGASSINCLWSFGNGAATPTTVQNTDAVSQTYLSPGTYSVVLIAQKGTCIDSVMKIITVDIPSKMEIPNVFTPNGDKVNDIFRIKASNLTEITATIFDRWGNKVYDVISDSGNIAWDGKNLQGKDCAEGVYFYIIKAKGKDGSEFEEKGNVSLFR